MFHLMPSLWTIVLESQGKITFPKVTSGNVFHLISMILWFFTVRSVCLESYLLNNRKAYNPLERHQGISKKSEQNV